MTELTIVEGEALTPGPQKWPWPSSLDALVAAPEFHTKIFENDRVRVLRTFIPAKALVPLHTHCFPAVAQVTKTSHFLRRDHEGNITFDSRMSGIPLRAPVVQWLEPLPPHTVENLGDSEIEIIIVELKS